MSRNLGHTSCERCKSKVLISGHPHLVRRDEAGAYFEEFERLVVAAATCAKCGAKYLAWVDDRAMRRPLGASHRFVGDLFFDLSFRSTFNDEPGPDDLPPWKRVERPTYEQLRDASREVLDRWEHEYHCCTNTASRFMKGHADDCVLEKLRDLLDRCRDLPPYHSQEHLEAALSWIERNTPNGIANVALALSETGQ